jgi:formylglycine-generating enzyme required for sulfatase activity
VTGEKGVSTFWAKGQPDDYGGDQDRALLAAKQVFRWDDDSHTKPRRFICEWEPGWKPPSTSPDSGRAAVPKPNLKEPDSLRVGLVGHWTFDEGTGTTARDSSGKGNHGTVMGGAKWAKGKVGGALEFDGRDDFVLIPNESSFDITRSITVAVWIKIASFTKGWQAIVTKGDTHGSWRLQRDDKESSLTWACSALSHHRYGDLRGGVAVDDGRWHHVAGVYDGTRTYLYVDGKVDTSARASGTIRASNYHVCIGHNAQEGGRHFHGLIDEFRIYDRALSAEEISLLAHPEEWVKAEPAPRSATRALDTLLTKFDSLMAKGDYTAAREWAEKAAGAPENAEAKEALEAAARVAKALADRPAAIRKGAESLVGREVRLKLTTKRMTAIVKAATDSGLTVATTYTINNQTRERRSELKWSALHADQMAEFAEKGGWKASAADGVIARAYLAFASSDLDRAESAAADQAKGHPLAKHLMGRVAKARAEAAYAFAMGLARERMKLRNWKGAVVALEAALEMKPGDEEATGLLAEVNSHIAPPPTLTLDLGRGVTMEFVYIEPGVFKMGDAAGRDDEKPVHEVAITKGFYLGKYEVTQAQYEVVTGRDPSRRKEPNRPVEQVTWNHAVGFCRLATDRTRRQFRLPTEAEWEYACRAGSAGKWCFGNDEASLGEYAWHAGDAGNQTHPVGQKRPNTWGLHDMHGNVWEWVADRYDANYYAKSPRSDPTGAVDGGGRVVRGGSWTRIAECRSATRHRNAVDYSYLNVGFRAVVSALPRASVSAQAAYDRAMARAKMRVRLKNWKGVAEACGEALKSKPATRRRRSSSPRPRATSLRRRRSPSTSAAGSPWKWSTSSRACS